MTPLRLRLMIGCGVFVALVAVAILGGGNESLEPAPAGGQSDQTPATTVAGTEDSPDEVTTSAALAGNGPAVDTARTVVEGGYPNTEQGALAASVALLEATEDVVAMTPKDAGQAQRLVSTAASADRLANKVEQQLIALAADAPGGVQIWIAPFEARTSPGIDGGWDVSIWYSQVVAIGTDTVVDNWTTVTYSMRWEGGAWKMHDSVSVAGPTPARSANVVPTPARTLIGVLSGYSDQGLAP